MKAVLCKTYGLPDSLVRDEIPPPTPADDEILIRVKACGLNFPDLLMIQNKYQFKPTLPFAPGGEISGEVETVGKTVTRFKAGDRVVALAGWGGFAEQVAVRANRLLKIPDSLDFIQAAGTLYTYGTSFHALKDRANLQPGETILVLGAAGGVGLAAVELGKVMGATVIAAASSKEKLAVCREKRATHLIEYSKENLRERVKEITGEKGVDVVFDPVGGDLSEAALRSMAWKGRYLVVGFAAGNIPQFPANLPLLKGCSIMGVFWGSFAEREPKLNAENFSKLIDMILAGKIKQHIHKIYPLEDAPIAMKDLMDRKVSGKAIIKVGTWSEQVVPSKSIKSQPVSKPGPLVVKISELKNLTGTSLGTSAWLTVTQEMINDFAKATHDHQWIHVDVERAKTEMPGGKTIAHGYLTMSLAARFFFEIIQIEGVKTAVNYGLNKARFPATVRSGSRIRMSGRITNVEDMSGGLKLFLECKMEVEGEEKPAYIGELITAIY